MSRGRRPIPAKLKRLAGNPGQRKIPVEPEVPRWDGEIPAYMSREARSFYTDFVPRVRQFILASKLDEPVLIMMSATWGLAMASLRKLKSPLVMNRRANKNKRERQLVRNPATTIWRDNVMLFLQMASKCGMTPSDRAKLFANEKPKDEAEQSVAAIMREHDTLDGNWEATRRKPQ